ncbi:CdaR family transcriptional regulator [Leucobacter sp. L43]|uniref:PucR family transcriptional regulator n=1 Tax=Leucobacter sp. L43 TaxID=2798040 RepID=UPI001902D469|nr:PucR family transcriptional regulator [Leucobacter sp. L43]
MSTSISLSRSAHTTTLGEILTELGSRTVSILGPDAGERLVRGTDFYDAYEELGEDPDTLLLAPSATGLPVARLASLAERASLLRYAAIAVKCHDDDVPTYAAIAETSGIPILRVSERIGWRLFDALLSQLLGERRHEEKTVRDRGAEPLFTLANDLADFFGGSVAIEDLGRRIIAYSSVPGQVIDTLRTQGILTRRVPASPFNDDQYRTVLRSAEPIKYPQLDDEEPRVAIAIRAGSLPLGTIWAIDASGEGPLDEEQTGRIRSAAVVAAEYMLDDSRVRRATQIPREDRMRTLLDGREVMGSELAELGIHEERGATLLVFAPVRNDLAFVPAQLRSTVQRHLALHHPEVVSVAHDGRVYALVANDSSELATSLAAPLLPIIDRLIGPGTRVATPGVAYRSGEVTLLKRLADQLFETATQHPELAGERLLTVGAMRPFLVLERAAALFAEHRELRSDTLERLEAEDPLVAETLLAWCSSFGNVARAARSLAVHENTVRYRLNRAEEKYGLDLGHADTLLIAWLQLRSPVGRHLHAVARRLDVGAPPSR